MSEVKLELRWNWSKAAGKFGFEWDYFEEIILENLTQDRKQITIWLDLFSPVFPKLFCFVKKKLFCFEEAAAVGYEKSTVELHKKAFGIR